MPQYVYVFLVSTNTGPSFKFRTPCSLIHESRAFTTETSLTEPLSSGLPGNGPAPLPAFSLNEDNDLVLRIDTDSLKFVQEKLDSDELHSRQKKSNLASSSMLVDRQDPPDDILTGDTRVEFLTNSFFNLVQEQQLVAQLHGLYDAVPDALDISVSELSEMFAFEDYDLREAYVQVLPVAAVWIPRAVPVADDQIVNKVNGITLTILGMIVAYQTGELLNQRIQLRTRGVMGSSCPKQEDTLCTHVLCMGANDECSPNTFLNGCKCHMGDCPASNRLQMFCEETDCGGQNPRTGLCKGREGDGKYKDCYCGTDDGLERYRFQESSFDTLDRIIRGGKWDQDETPDEPEPEPEPEKNCPKEKYPGAQNIAGIPGWIEENQCKDVCPGEKWDFCPIDSSSPPNTGLCQCTDKKCTDAGLYACWVNR